MPDRGFDLLDLDFIEDHISSTVALCSRYRQACDDFVVKDDTPVHLLDQGLLRTEILECVRERNLNRPMLLAMFFARKYRSPAPTLSRR